MRMLNVEEESDDAPEVTWEDQQKINAFSKLNTRAGDMRGELAQLRQEREALDDLSIELELVDEDERVLYRVGEAFIHMSLAEAQAMLVQDQRALEADMDRVQEKADECGQTMKELKVDLYAKFGKAINLDA